MPLNIEIKVWCTVELTLRPIVKEAGRTPPPFPSIFFKPNTTVLGHGAPVIIPKIAQDEQADYEGELACMQYASIVSFLALACALQLIKNSASSLGKMQRTSHLSKRWIM